MKAEDRTRLIMNALGWQGGTIHQVAKITGCDPTKLLYDDVRGVGDLSSSFSLGWFAVRTCSLEHNLATNFPRHRGDIDFWLGVASGQNLKELGDNDTSEVSAR